MKPRLPLRSSQELRATSPEKTQLRTQKNNSTTHVGASGSYEEQPREGSGHDFPMTSLGLGAPDAMSVVLLLLQEKDGKREV